MNTGTVPRHLLAQARVGFLNSLQDMGRNSLWRQIAFQHNLDGQDQDFVNIGAAPMPVESKTGVTLQDGWIERVMTLTSRSWDITVWLSQNAIDDDRTNELEGKVRSAGENFELHMNELVFDALNSGAGTTYGLCYDGQYFFDSDHADAGAEYTTVQSNVNTLSLTLDNFETVYVAASTRLNDRGKQTGIMPNLLVVPPALERRASQIVANPANYANANNEVNPYNGKVNYLVAPWIDSTSWYLAATTGARKPIILVMRQAPSLQEAWFDPTKPDGGYHFFKFYARYWVAYGDWRLATQGNT